jgi:glycosyltransferase involved in cell wall biosynthesis
MQTLKLYGLSSYITPITKRRVVQGESFNAMDEEAELLKRTGRFFSSNAVAETIPGFATAVAPALSLPPDWSGKNILIKSYGGIGDCLIAGVVASTLKTKPCAVAMKTLQSGVEFAQCLTDVDLASDQINENGYDIFLDLSGFLQESPRKVISGDFYVRAISMAGLSSMGFKLPTLTLGDMSYEMKKALGVNPTDLITIHTDTSAQHKNWPDFKWQGIINKLSEKFQIAVVGQRDGFENTIDMSSFSPREQMLTVRLSKLFIGVDSCFLHVAGLLRKNAIGLFGPTCASDIVGRYASVDVINSPVECDCKRSIYARDCKSGFKCMQGITEEMVLDRAINALDLPHNRQKKAQKKTENPAVLAHVPDTRSFDDLKRNQRVAFLFPHSILGGGEVSMLEVAEGLSEYFDLQTFALDLQRQPGTVHIKKELKERLNAKFLKRNEFTPNAFNSFDIIIFYGPFDIIPQTLQMIKPRRPVVIRVCHTHFDSETVDFASRWENVIDGTCCVSPVISRKIEGSTFIPNPVSVEKLEGSKKKFFSKGKTLGYIGRLDDNKNVKWLVKNLPALGCNLLVQGIDSDQVTAKQLRSIAEGEGVPDKLLCVQPSDKVGTTLRSIDALVIASKSEALPMVLLEAAWLGVPVISTKVGAIPELFEGLVTLVDSRRDKPDLQQLQEAVKNVSRAKCKRMQTRVKEICDPEAVVQQYRKYIRRTYGTFLDPAVRTGPVSMQRWEGAGDVIAASACIRRIQEILPDTPLVFETGSHMQEIMQRTFPDIEVITQDSPRGPIFELSYNDCWTKGVHIVEGMGGKVSEIDVTPNKKMLGGREKAKSVGLFPSSNKGNKFRLKEWPHKKWAALGAALKKEGWRVIQLGHKDDDLIDPSFEDGRVDSIDALFGSFKRVQHVIAIEGLANHIGYVLGKPIVIIQGKGSDHTISSYLMHTHVLSDFDCRCYGSIHPSLIASKCEGKRKVDSPPCMQAVDESAVLEVFRTFSRS